MDTETFCIDAAKVKTVIHERGLSYTELSRISGVNRRTIEGWFARDKTFNPSISEIAKIARALGVSLDTLVGGSPPTESENFYVKYSRYESLLDRVDKLDLNSVAIINEIVDAFYNQRYVKGN